MANGRVRLTREFDVVVFDALRGEAIERAVAQHEGLRITLAVQGRGRAKAEKGHKCEKGLLFEQHDHKLHDVE